jgi:hypothetical protein
MEDVMANTRKDAKQNQTDLQKRAIHPIETSSDLPSSYGDSSRNMTPKDVTPQDACWNDLQERKISTKDSAKKTQAHQHAMPDSNQLSDVPSSHGDSPQEVTPKDIMPEHAAWNDLQRRHIASDNDVEREESLLDEAIELTFPASDPAAELPAKACSEKAAHLQDEEEGLLDEAIELTFPASDPISITPHEKPAASHSHSHKH